MGQIGTAAAFIAQDGADPLRALSPAAGKLVREAIVKYAAGEPRQVEVAASTAWDCLASAAILRTGLADSSERLKAAVDALLRIGAPHQSGALTWSIPARPPKRSCRVRGELDAFNDGTCNPPGTGYGFQSGVAAACLAEASDLLHDSHLLDVAQASLRHWESLSEPVRGCRSCRTFRYSDDPNDSGRSVRNINLFLGLAAASVGAHGKVDAALKVVDRVLATEEVELSNKNFGYLGSSDPRFRKNPEKEGSRTEDHYVSMLGLVNGIGVLTGDRRAAELAARYYRIWADCRNERCRNNGCGYWSGDIKACSNTHSFGHCQLRSRDPAAAAKCEEVIKRGKLQNPYALLQVLTPLQ